MNQINWNLFKVKNDKKESSAFQDMCYLLFCAEFNNRIGLFRYKNQKGIETEPLEYNGKLYGFQSKYYDENSTIGGNKTDIIDSINIAKQKNPDLKYFYLYVNKELSESSKKEKKKPAYQEEIENAAKEKDFSLIWRVPSNIELQLCLPENRYIYEIFFEQGPTASDLLDEIKSHNELILQDIREDICFNNINIKFDRSEIIKNIYSNLMDNKNIVISGEGGSGKTAVLKRLYSSYLGNFPVCIFKASELNVNNINHVFDFGSRFSLLQFSNCFADEEKKFFVIDSAEKLSELQDVEIVKNLLLFLQKEKWILLFTVRCSYLSDLEFLLKENFNLPYEIQNIDNLSYDELFKVLSDNSIPVPENENLKELVRNLFYLSAYIKYCPPIDTNITLKKFYDILWEKKIKNASVTKDDMHIKREEIFLQITRQRCEKGKFFIPTKDYSPKIIAALKQDEILEYDVTHNGVFITHDIYEEWGLDRIISVAFENHITPDQFFSEIGTSLPIRRAFRSWLQSQLLDAGDSIKNFIKEIFLDENVEQFWKDELLISVILSDYANSFFNYFETSLIDNDFYLLKRCLFLLRIACAEVKSFLEYDIYKPIGKGWESVVSLIYKHRDDFFTNNFRIVLPIFKCWALNTKDGETTKQCGLLLLNLLEKCESGESFYLQDENEVFGIISNCAKEIKTELETIFSKLLNSEISRGSIYHRFADKVLSESIRYVGVIVTIPHIILKLCASLWSSKKYDDGISFSIGMETAYGLEKNWSYNYASAYKTPIYWLLRASFSKALDFIIDFTNKSVEHYKKSYYGNDVEEVVLNINNKITKQYLSWSIWSMFRGGGSPVVPGLLQSIHMALEKVLLEFANNPENKNNLKEILNLILLKSKSASLTAVVCSVVLAHPQDFYEIALILFKTIQFFYIDLIRCSREFGIKSLYRFAVAGEAFYAQERLATCEDKFRNQTLESLFLQYQYWGIKDFSEEQNTEFLSSIYNIIDEHKTHFSQDSVKNDKYEILLARFDRRNLRANVVEQKDGSVQIGFVPIQLDERLQNISNETNKNMENMNKYASLLQWADFLEIDNKNHNNNTQYDREPLKALSEVKSLISELSSGKILNAFIYCYIPVYVCSKLIIYHKDKLTKDDKKYCHDIIISAVNNVFSEDYGYQIHDGVEAATHAIPYLMLEFPNDKIEYIKKIILLLLNTTPIGEYKRVCDYALESIISANLWKADYTAAKLILSYYLQLRTEMCKLVATLKKDKYLMNELVSEKLENISRHSQGDSVDPEIDNLSLEDYDILLQLVPSNTEDKFLLNLYKIIVAKVAVLIFQHDSNITNYYRLQANVFKSCSHFILNHNKDEILIYLQPLVDKFAQTEGVADFLDSLICAQDKMNKKEAFWTVWNAMYSKIKSMTTDSSSYYIEKILISYLLAWRRWGEEQKEWNGLSVENKCFYDKVSRELNHLPVTLYSISRVLNTIGTCFFNEGIFWLHNIISAKKINKLGDLENGTIFYLEKYMRKFIYDKKLAIKKDSHLKSVVIDILTYMINLASAYAYILRESIL